MAQRNALFCFNNWVDVGTFSASSALSDYPSSNLSAGIRSQQWKPAGTFEISATNNKVYINGTTFTLTNGTYTSATLITHFNSVTSQTLSRNSLGRFVITLGSSGTLNLASTTNAVWFTLGFLGTSNLTGTAFTADERRYSTGEWIKVDMLIPQQAEFCAVVGNANEVFSAPTATVKLQGNNLDLWDSPPVEVTLEVSDLGCFAAPEDLQACRFWRVFIDDRKNNSIGISAVYIGSAVKTTNTNISTGFTRNRADTSIRLYSEGGQLYVTRRPKVLTLTNTGMLYLGAQDRIDMEQLIYDLGVNKPFFLVLDPGLNVSASLKDMTHYVYQNGDASLTHVLRDYYNVSFDFREVL
jgi:hypothetical protein